MAALKHLNGESGFDKSELKRDFQVTDCTDQTEAMKNATRQALGNHILGNI